MRDIIRFFNEYYVDTFRIKEKHRSAFISFLGAKNQNPTCQ